MSFNNRINIEIGLGMNLTASKIAKSIGKDVSSVTREIKRNLKMIPCRETCSHCVKNCLKRTFIDGKCANFVENKCRKLEKFPYCCNNCPNRRPCKNTKYVYNCSYAHEKARNLLKKSRSYVNLNEKEIEYIDKVVWDGVMKNQSLFHIFESDDYLKKITSLSSLRRYVYKGILNTKAHHLKQYVVYKHEYDYERRKRKSIEHLYCRTYDFYLDFVKQNPNFNIFQYDSVIGKKTDKFAILTITNVETTFQFGRLILKSNRDSVLAEMNNLKEIFGEKFYDIFQINLADNGVEFETFDRIEFDENGEQRINTFFTRPYKSSDKGKCERNHEFIRYVIPKGETLDFLTQNKLNLLFSNINSYKRKNLKGLSPYEVFVKKFGVEICNKLNISFVPAKEVNLSRNLLK